MSRACSKETGVHRNRVRERIRKAKLVEAVKNVPMVGHENTARVIEEINTEVERKRAK